MELDYKALSFWVQVVNLVGLICVGIYARWSNSNKANFDAIEVLNNSIVKDRILIAEEFANIRGDVKNALTHDDLETVYSRINEMADTLATLGGQISQMNQGVQLIHQYLLTQGKR